MYLGPLHVSNCFGVQRIRISQLGYERSLKKISKVVGVPYTKFDGVGNGQLGEFQHMVKAELVRRVDTAKKFIKSRSSLLLYNKGTYSLVEWMSWFESSKALSGKGNFL